MSPDDLDTQPYLESTVPSPGPTPLKIHCHSFEDVETKRKKYQGNPKLPSTMVMCPETPSAAPVSSHDSKGDHAKTLDTPEPVKKATPAPTVEPEADLEKNRHAEVLVSRKHHMMP